MSPFKEPQPRKKKDALAADAGKVIGGNWPPYERQGGEANWKECPPEEEPKPSEDAKARLAEWANTPIMVVPDYHSFELRKAALEAACAMQGDKHNSVFWKNLSTFEEYLRDGTKPS